MDRPLIRPATAMAVLLDGMNDEQRRQAARQIAEVIHSTPPGVGRADYLRGMLARVDGGNTTYEDRIILDGCPVDLLRALLQMLAAVRAQPA